MSKKKDDKLHTIQNYVIPRRDEHGQWWYGYQKVRMVTHPEWSKELFNRNKDKEDGD